MRISDWSSDVCSSDLLVAADPADAEIARIGMPEIVARHRGRRQHGEALGQDDPRLRAGVQKLEQRRLLGVVGTGGIARRRSDALIPFLDQGLVVEVLVWPVAPAFLAYPPVHKRKSVGEGK